MKIHTAEKPPEKVSWGVVPGFPGKFVIGLNEKGQLCRCSILRKGKAADIVRGWQRAWPQTAFISGAKLDHWRKKPLLMIGTKFQQEVWKIMARIPKGSVTTYGNIARYLGKPMAARAVGAACGANPVLLLIPCHRVITSNGGLGGYAGGLEVKQMLLRTEGYLRKPG